MHSLEFSPVTNQLTAYLQNNSPFEYSDPLRTINTDQQLQIQFNALKQRCSSRTHDLQRRLELCLSVHRGTEDRMDESRSRIKVDRNSLSMERYGDLLEHNFREVTWTKTSRVKIDPQTKERNTVIKKIQEEIDAFQNEFFQFETKQEELLRQLEQTIEKDAQYFAQTIKQKSQQTTTAYSTFENRVSQFQNQFNQQMTSLESSLANTSLHLLTLIDSSLSQINSQLPP